LPQWNCSCKNCFQARSGILPSRTQSSVAISADGDAWYLINASPDLRAQIEAFPGLHPSPDTPRNSPIAGVLLTNADLDHVLGVFLLRERSSLRVYGPRPVFDVLKDDLHLIDTLKPFCRIDWQDTTADYQPLLSEKGESTGLKFRALPLSTKPPPFASSAASPERIQSVAYEFVDDRTKARLLVAPDVAAITPELLAAIGTADVVLFDGTFWSNHEFQETTGKPRTSDDMGHLTVRDGSLEVLRNAKARHKIYLHINNTNPILDPNSPERAEVDRAGIVVGHDGLELEL
jgi:pyrroloquinoline quinone biosynthesis protein B